MPEIEWEGGSFVIPDNRDPMPYYGCNTLDAALLILEVFLSGSH